MKRIFCFLLSLMMLFSVLSFSASAALSDVLGQETTLEKNTALATSSVNDDLKNMGVDLSKYPYKEGAESELFSFYENGDEYYVYIYNPSRMKYDVGSALNMIHMAVRWNSEGNATETGFYDLGFISGSGETDTLGHLFLKFRIRKDCKIPSLKVGSGRSYDIVEVELLPEEENTAKALNVSSRYTYFGSGSTLRAEVENFTTVEIDTHYTYYRTGSNSVGNVTGRVEQNQLNSVYFSVPNEWFEDGRTLVGVEAKWDQYKTKPVLVTDDERYFNILNQYKELPTFYLPEKEDSESLKYYPFSNPVSLLPCAVTETFYKPFHGNYNAYRRIYPWTFGVRFNDVYPIYPISQYEYAVYKWAFLAESMDFGEIAVSSERIEDVIYTNGSSFILQNHYNLEEFAIVRYPYKGVDLTYFDHDAFLYYDRSLGRIVFEEPVYEKHGSGYRKEQIYLTDKLESEDFDFPNTFVGAFFAWLTGGSYGESFQDVVPICRVDDKVITAGADKAYVAESDWEDFCSFKFNSDAEGRQTYLLRFDVSDYIVNDVDVFYNSASGGESFKVKSFEETVYLNFDIIEFTFMEEGEFRRIRAEGIDVDDYLDENPEAGDRVPVVNDPINGIGDLVNPKIFEFTFFGFEWPDFGGMPDWLENLLVLLRFIFGFVIVFFLLWLFVKFVWPVLVWIGKGIASFFKGASSVTKKGVAKFRSTSLYQKTSSAVKKGTAAIREKRQQSKKKERTKKKK